jgi:hypothetical protein
VQISLAPDIIIFCKNIPEAVRDFQAKSFIITAKTTGYNLLGRQSSLVD